MVPVALLSRLRYIDRVGELVACLSYEDDAMALTPFGKVVRKIRIDRELLMKDLADKIGVSSAFLSAVEAGRKQLPSDLIERIAKAITLGDGEIADLEEAAVATSREVRISLSSSSSRLDQSVAALLARKFSELDDKQLADIKGILERRRD